MTSDMNPSRDEHSVRFKHSREKIICKYKGQKSEGKWLNM